MSKQIDPVSVKKNKRVLVMSSYFDEHNCTPLADGTAPDELLQFARFENMKECCKRGRERIFKRE